MVITGGSYKGQNFSTMIDPYTEVMPLKEGYYVTTGICMMDEGNHEAVLVFDDSTEKMVYGEIVEFPDYYTQKEEMAIVNSVLESFVEKK